MISAEYIINIVAALATSTVAATAITNYSRKESATNAAIKYSIVYLLTIIIGGIYILVYCTSYSPTTHLWIYLFTTSITFLRYLIVCWNPAVKDFFRTVPQGSLSSAGETCIDKENLPKSSKTLQIKSGDFYKEYHSHKTKHLVTLKEGLTLDSADVSSDNGQTFIYLCGDSSLDNKHWFFHSRTNKSKQMKNNHFTSNAVNGFENILTSPSRMVMDVSYHMNDLAERRFGSGQVCTIMSSIEESTIADREQSPSGMLYQDHFIRDNITENDILIVSVGGNDIALNPTVRTAFNMAMLVRSPMWMIEQHVAPGFGYFVKLFQSRIAKMIRTIVGKGGIYPKEILICMIYYPNPIPGGSWADHTLKLLGYDDHPDKLQLVIRCLFDAISNIGFKKLSSHTKVTPFPLFKVLNEDNDYCQRVEPSVSGGRKMANAFLNHLFGSEKKKKQSPKRPIIRMTRMPRRESGLRMTRMPRRESGRGGKRRNRSRTRTSEERIQESL
jgi:hypothetical protein